MAKNKNSYLKKWKLKFQFSSGNWSSCKLNPKHLYPFFWASALTQPCRCFMGPGPITTPLFLGHQQEKLRGALVNSRDWGGGKKNFSTKFGHFHRNLWPLNKNILVVSVIWGPPKISKMFVWSSSVVRRSEGHHLSTIHLNSSKETCWHFLPVKAWKGRHRN